MSDLIAADSADEIEWLFLGDPVRDGHPAYIPGEEPPPAAGRRVVVGPLPEAFRGKPVERHLTAGYLARHVGICIATWRTQMPDFHGFFGLAAREGHHV